MGLISTVNVFALLVAPTAIVIRGYDLKWRQCLLFSLIALVFELGVLMFDASHRTVELQAVLPHPLLPGMIARIAATCAVAYALRERRLVKSLGLQRTETRSVVAIGVSVAHGLLHNVGPLYQTASAPGFEIDVLLAAVHVNVTFVLSLLLVEALATAPAAAVVASVCLCGALDAMHPSLDANTTLTWYAASAITRAAFLWAVKREKVAVD